MKNKDLITDEQLEKVSGGIGLPPGLPGFGHRRKKDPAKDEPKDGGATGGW